MKFQTVLQRKCVINLICQCKSRPLSDINYCRNDSDNNSSNSGDSVRTSEISKSRESDYFTDETPKNQSTVKHGFSTTPAKPQTSKVVDEMLPTTNEKTQKKQDEDESANETMRTLTNADEQSGL